MPKKTIHTIDWEDADSFRQGPALIESGLCALPASLALEFINQTLKIISEMQYARGLDVTNNLQLIDNRIAKISDELNSLEDRFLDLQAAVIAGEVPESVLKSKQAAVKDALHAELGLLNTKAELIHRLEAIKSLELTNTQDEQSTVKNQSARDNRLVLLVDTKYADTILLALSLTQFIPGYEGSELEHIRQSVFADKYGDSPVPDNSKPLVWRGTISALSTIIDYLCQSKIIKNDLDRWHRVSNCFVLENQSVIKPKSLSGTAARETQGTKSALDLFLDQYEELKTAKKLR
jgi:hypothetical protein